ncbi:MAG: hypothetical protein QM813_06430 [Verrucomicrobiota bacterium]
MKTLMLALLLLPVLTYAQDTNSPARIQRGETWASESRLERIAKDYVKQQKIEFTFEKTYRNVSVGKRGTNAFATIWFSSGMGQPILGVEIAPSGTVITNYTGIAVCGTGRKP